MLIHADVGLNSGNKGKNTYSLIGMFLMCTIEE